MPSQTDAAKSDDLQPPVRRPITLPTQRRSPAETVLAPDLPAPERAEPARPKADLDRFAELLRAARAARGLTQEDFARHAGIGVRTLRDLERGNARPQRATVDLLLAALNVAGVERESLLTASGRTGGSRLIETHLPPRPTLIGRESDVIALSAAVARNRLITLVGVAGVGKTSLAVDVAHHLAPSFPGGTSAVAISEVSTGSDVMTTVAAVFDVARAGDVPGRLAGRAALLVLDGAERAPGPAMAVLSILAVTAPSLHVVVTSRHPIGLPNELVWPVAPLDVPPTDAVDFSRYPAVALFKARLDVVRRAPITDADEAVVATLVRQLGGLPLALELAAARGRILDVREILDRYGHRVLDLGGTPEAAEIPTTLRDAVGESYRLLDITGQDALRRLASFRHRWSLEMAEPLLADIATDPVAVLERLVGLGLVQILGAGSARFRLLDVVRDFAAEQRDAAGEQSRAAEVHAQVITALVRRIAPDLVGAMFLSAVRRLDDIASDIRAALAHTTVHAPLTALSLAAALPRWWRFRGRDREGREIIRRLLDSPETAAASAAERAWAQLGASLLAGEHGEALAELPSATEALATFARLEDLGGQLAAHTQLVAVHHSEGAYELAREHGEAAFALATRAGRRRDVLVASTNLTWHDIRTGALDTAGRRLTALRKLAGELGEDRLAALALANLAEVARLDGRYPDAVLIGRQAVAFLEQHGDPRHRRSALFTVAIALAESGRSDEAMDLLNALRTVAADVPGAEGTTAMVEAYLALNDGDRGSAAQWFAAARETLVGQPDARDVVEALVGLVAATDDEAVSARARAELASVCEVSAVTLLPRDIALMARGLSGSPVARVVADDARSRSRDTDRPGHSSPAATGP